MAHASFPLFRELFSFPHLLRHFDANKFAVFFGQKENFSSTEEKQGCTNSLPTIFTQKNSNRILPICEFLIPFHIAL